METTRLNGSLGTDLTNALDGPDTIDVLYTADAAIVAGRMVMLDVGADNTLGTLCVPATTTDDHLVLGVYTGKGQVSGAISTNAAAIVSPSGVARDAVSGDSILVRTYGRAYVEAGGTITRGHSCTIDASTAGQPIAVDNSALAGVAAAGDCLDGHKPYAVALEAGADGVVSTFFLRFM